MRLIEPSTIGGFIGSQTKSLWLDTAYSDRTSQRTDGSLDPRGDSLYRYLLERLSQATNLIKVKVQYRKQSSFNLRAESQTMTEQ